MLARCQGMFNLINSTEKEAVIYCFKTYAHFNPFHTVTGISHVETFYFP